MKRLFDVLASIVILILALPIMAIIAIAIRIHLGAPVLFRQQRPGRHGRFFQMFKFRTMSEAVDECGRPLPDAERMTRLGKWLRSTSLDEIPEFWNVLRGDMSFVGPRPLLPQYLDRYTPEQRRRHSVRPGITGWAQINGRNAVPWEDRLAMDVWYVDHVSWMLDLKILHATIGSVVRRNDVSSANHATMPEFQGTRSTGEAGAEP